MNTYYKKEINYKITESKVPKRDTITNFDFSILEDKGYEYYYNHLKNIMFQDFKRFDHDLITESILHLCRVADKYDENKCTKVTFLKMTLRNFVYQKYNKDIKYNHISIDDEENLLQLIDIETENKEDSLDSIIEIINREEFYLLKEFALNNLSYQEIVDKYNLPMHNVKNHIRFQRIELKKILKQKKVI